MNANEQKEARKAYWSQRFFNPHIRMKWMDEIAVEPANKDKGVLVGFRTYPTGERESFTVS